MDFLKARLYDLPRELDEYFQRMLEAVDKIYHHRNSQILQVLSIARGPVPLSFMAYLKQEGDFALSLGTPSSYYPGGSEQTQVSRLRAHGGDLITIDNCPDDEGYVKSRQVTLLHRTVSDFLMRGEMKQFLLNRLQTPFDPVMYLANATIATVENLSQEDAIDTSSLLNNLLLEFLWYSRLAEQRRNPVRVHLLDKMNRLYCDISSKRNYTDPISEKYQLSYSSNWMFQIAVLSGLKSYLSSWLKRDPELAKLGNGKHSPLLDLALQPPDSAFTLETGSIFPQVDSDIVSLLLGCGAQPNQEWRSSTVWHRFLRRVHADKADFVGDNVELMTIVKGLLNAGADFNTEVVVGTKTQGGGIGAGRQYLIKETPKTIIATYCSPEDLNFFSEQYAHPGILQQLLHGIGWV